MSEAREPAAASEQHPTGDSAAPEKGETRAHATTRHNQGQRAYDAKQLLRHKHVST